MKGLISVVILLVVAACVRAADQVNLRLSAGNAGSFAFTQTTVDALSGAGSSGSGSSDTEAGFAIAGEYLRPVSERFSLGGGFEYLHFRRFKNDPNPVKAEFGFLPIYLTGRLFPFSRADAAPYVRVNLGYSLLYLGNNAFQQIALPQSSSQLKSGPYWSLGLGLRLMDNLFADVAYSAYYGVRELNFSWPGNSTRHITSNETYTALSLNLNYAFDLD